ncbi:Ycf48-like protein [subsurface metagenome]
MKKGITSIKVDATNPARVYLAADEGVYFSESGGESWKELNQGLITEDVKSLAIATNGKVYGGTKGYGIYTLEPGRKSWQGPFAVTNFGVHWHVWDRPLYLYNALLISPTNPETMYLGSFPSGFYKSTDGGRTWHETNIKFTNDGAFYLTFHPDNEEIIYAGTYNGVSKSEDAGRSWRKIDQGMPPEQWVFSIVINPDNPDIIYSASKNGQNKGKDARDFYGMVMKSIDGGESWFEIMNGLDKNEEFYQLVIYPDNHNILFLSSWGRVYFTDNGGESWQPINDGLDVPPGVVNNVANNLDIDAEGRYLYLGTGGRGVYRVDLRQLNLEKN